MAALKLINTLQQRHEEMGLSFFLGYVNADKHSKAHLFWQRYAKAFPQHYEEIASVGFWLRFLKHRQLASKLGQAWEAWGIRALSLLQGTVAITARAHALSLSHEQLSKAHSFIQQSHSQGYQLNHHWSAERLSRQLASPLSKSYLILDRHQEIKGLSNYYLGAMKSRESFKAGIIDLLMMDGLNFQEQCKLLNETSAAIATDGAEVAMLPSFDKQHALSLLASGYLYIPKRCHLITLFKDPLLSLQGVGQIIFR
ncbi:MAG: hypothetical protein R2880_02665 [Deinococcales bacterium]